MSVKCCVDGGGEISSFRSQSPRFSEVGAYTWGSAYSLWSTCHTPLLCLRASTLGIFLRFSVSHLLGMWRNANCSPLASWHYIPECLVGFQLENVCLFERKLSSQHCRWGPASFIQVNAGGHFRFTLNNWKLFGCFPCSRSSHPSRCCERFSIVLCVVATPQPSNYSVATS